MAGAMLQAFRDAWPTFMGEDTPVPNVNNPQMKLMFVAIARGVVRHLTENPNAFVINRHPRGAHNHSFSINLGWGNIDVTTDTVPDHDHDPEIRIEGS